jgi:hypothetical protein
VQLKRLLRNCAIAWGGRMVFAQAEVWGNLAALAGGPEEKNRHGARRYVLSLESMSNPRLRW